MSPSDILNENQNTILHDLDKISEKETNKEMQRDSNLVINNIKS